MLTFLSSRLHYKRTDDSLVRFVTHQTCISPQKCFYASFRWLSLLLEVSLPTLYSKKEMRASIWLQQCQGWKLWLVSIYQWLTLYLDDVIMILFVGSSTVLFSSNNKNTIIYALFFIRFIVVPSGKTVWTSVRSVWSGTGLPSWCSFVGMVWYSDDYWYRWFMLVCMSQLSYSFMLDLSSLLVCFFLAISHNVS